MKHRLFMCLYRVFIAVSALIKPLPRLVHSHASFPAKIKSLVSAAIHLSTFPRCRCVDGEPTFHIWRGKYRDKRITGQRQFVDDTAYRMADADETYDPEPASCK